MPSWNLFSAKKNGSTSSGLPSARDTTAISGSRHATVTSEQVSTLSSAGEIMKSVSVANMSASKQESLHKPKSQSHFIACMCCGTQLEVPDGLAYFKCSICDTFHDVKNSTCSQEPYILDLSKLRQIVNLLQGQIYDNCAIDSSSSGSETNLVPAVVATSETSNNTDDSNAEDRWKELSDHISRTCSDISSLVASFAATVNQKKMSYSKPNIDFDKLVEFYSLIVELPPDQGMKVVINSFLTLLKRIKKPLEVQDLPFLLIIIENPFFINNSLFSLTSSGRSSSLKSACIEVLERCVGILAHCSKPMKAYLLNWFSRYSLERIEPKINLLNAYVAHRLTHQYKSSRRQPTMTRIGNVRLSGGSGRRRSEGSNSRSGERVGSSSSQHRHRLSDLSLGSFVPQMPAIAYQISHSKRRRPSTSNAIRLEFYSSDWNIASFVQVLSIFFNANVISNKVAISCFYNTMVDYSDVTSDFEAWQRQGGKSLAPGVGNSLIESSITSSIPITSDPTIPPPGFTFCQYPFLLSMGSKTEILEYDARRQMELKARQSFFGSLDNKNPENPFLYIKIHRQNLLEESLEALEKNEENLKKSLKVEFIDEPGVDAGGLRKEWFLLLIKQLFDPSYGLFTEVEDSRYCWFDYSSDISLKLYKLSGVAVGLALYNSIILDINFPLVFYKKLLGEKYNLEDFCTVNPAYGKSLMALLEYNGEDDFEQTFSLTFTINVKDSKTGKIQEVPLVPHGDKKHVTKANRHQFVKRLLEFHFDKSVHRQFEALKQGFYSVVGGNALSLFRAQELELLIRGSLDAIDVDALRSVTKYHNWVSKGSDAEQHVVIKWFWKFFRELDTDNQRKLLQFVTGSDRIPSTGIANIPFRISKVGDDCERFPTAHTCFNQLCLYAYSSRQKMEQKLLTAIKESEGFGIK